MKPGSFLKDADRGEERFRVKELLCEGRSYQIALATDLHLDDKLVCVKAIHYDADRIKDPAYVQARRQALRDEMAFLTLRNPLLPDPLDWIELEGSPAGGLEPLLVYEYQHGPTLHELIRERHPEGIAPLRALRIFRELARLLGDIHEQGYVFRDLDPRHVIIGLDDVVHVVGCGNATKMGEKPNAAKPAPNPVYAAPEVRNEMSGQMLRRASDIYSLGALMSYMLTGQEPRESVENPLTKAAFDRLSAINPPGISLLVARCIQPLAKKRFTHVRKMLPFCEADNLPTASTEGFGLIMLPAPWAGAESPESNRALQSKISAGPLLSVPAGSDARGSARPDGADHAEGEQPQSRRRLWIGLVAGLALVLILAALTIWRIM